MTKELKYQNKEVSEERGESIFNSSLFKTFITKAVVFLGTPGRIFKLVSEAYKKSDNLNGIGSFTTKLKIQVFGLFDMVTDYVKGNYKEIETKNVVMVIAGIIYLVSPLDLVPDFIPFFGFLDDISILSFIISKLSSEIENYLLWKNHIIKKPKKEVSKPQIIDITDNTKNPEQ